MGDGWGGEEGTALMIVNSFFLHPPREHRFSCAVPFTIAFRSRPRAGQRSGLAQESITSLGFSYGQNY